jgi:glycosyltransferase involved in cell wall biosynthesis
MKNCLGVSVKVLLVTEKCSPDVLQRDGGAMLVRTLQRAFGDSLSIMQFGSKTTSLATWNFDYPSKNVDRFQRRLVNSRFIAECVKKEEHNFTHVIFIHVSMQFGLIDIPLSSDIDVWTFPMFLTPSYQASGEVVPDEYIQAERLTLAESRNILTPSHFEKRQLVNDYFVLEKYIHVIPRGVDIRHLAPKTRSLTSPINFCSIGSIKPQKNTLGLIQLFVKIREKFPESTLKIIGPNQNTEYFSSVCRAIKQQGLSEFIQLVGYVSPNDLASVIDDAHFHLSASTCETFGRSIFESLASGILSIGRESGNSAAEFLSHVPYARFADNDDDAINHLTEMTNSFSMLSSMALEIGTLYDDEILSRLIVAKIFNKDVIAISDFDGTLYHKNDAEKTLRCFSNFKKFPIRVVCSARPLSYLIEELRNHKLEVDWIIGCSGSIVSNGSGMPLWIYPLNSVDVTYLEGLSATVEYVKNEESVLQIALPVGLLPNVSGLREEIYQNTAFIAHWQSSKLRAVHRLLTSINWLGQVRAFGDGIYDLELLNYFDGTLITPSPINISQKKEIEFA